MAMSISSRSLRRVALLAGVVAIATAIALPAVASADSPPTSVKLSENAVYVWANQINVPVTVSCTAGSGYWVNVNVVQPQSWGFTMFGGGSAGGQCTGQQQKIVVPVYSFNYYGGWILGDASATAEACTWACASDTKQIHVGL
jgi:hypothetical protein